MYKNDEVTKRLFNIIGRLKRANIHSISDVDNDIRPSEEMFLIKIDIFSLGHRVKVSDLINLLNFAPSTVSTILKVLESKGYITREINKENRREVFVEITNKGKSRLEIAKKYHFDTVSDLISYLGEEDGTKLIDILEKTTCFFENRKNERENNNDKNI